MKSILTGVLFGLVMAVQAADPEVKDMLGGQVAGKKTVEITYTLSDDDSDELAVSLVVTGPNNFSQEISGLPSEKGKQQTYTWSAAGTDWDGKVGDLTFTLTADDGEGGVSPAGDPTAIAWEVVNDRWVKNTYANGDDTMSDVSNNNIWLCNAELGSMDWYSAVSYCDNLSYAGYTDWALPSVSFLYGLRYEEAVFTGLGWKDYGFFWSGESYDVDRAKYVLLGIEWDIGNYSKNSSGFSVWPVRSR